MNAVTPKIRKIPVPEDVATVLRLSTVAGNMLVLPPALERKLYERTNRVLEVLGGTWNRRAKAHIFGACADADAVRALLGIAVTTGAAEGLVDRKRTLEFFETPADVAVRMATHAVLYGRTVLEPSAGHGRLVNAALLRGASAVHCVEIDPENCDALRREFPAEDLHHFGAYVGVTCRDFLTWEPRRGLLFDGVVMNPPFSRNQDIAHIRHAARFVKPGGYISAVLSPHGFFASDKASVSFRAWLGRFNHTVEDLPAKTFAAEGTDVETKLLRMQLE